MRGHCNRSQHVVLCVRRLWRENLFSKQVCRHVIRLKDAKHQCAYVALGDVFRASNGKPWQQIAFLMEAHSRSDNESGWPVYGKLHLFRTYEKPAFLA